MRLGFRITTFLLVLIRPLLVDAGDVLRNVPRDALGFVVIKDLAATDGKIVALLKTFHVDGLSPLGLLQTATGLSDGVDTHGDFLIAALPGNESSHAASRFAIWLPVRDYRRLVASSGGAPEQRITAAGVAGQDVLVAHHGDWALVMDPDQRTQMEQILESPPQAPMIVDLWKDWIAAHDIAVVVLHGGVRAAFTAVAATDVGRGAQADSATSADDNPFNAGQNNADVSDVAVARRSAPDPSDIPGAMQAAVRQFLRASPRLAKLASEANAIGCALRLDDKAGAMARLRISLPPRRLIGSEANQGVLGSPSLYRGRGFVLHGGGKLHRQFLLAAGEAFAQSSIEDLQSQERLVLDDAAMLEFRQAIGRAFHDVQSVEVLTQPGDQDQPVYTNDYLIVHVDDANQFVTRLHATFDAWNRMNRSGEGETRLVFETDDVNVGDRAAKRYTLDIAAAEGVPDDPDLRKAMEKMFGPGGKMQLWIVPVDSNNVLLASATAEQVAAAVKVLGEKQQADWQRPELVAANASLPQDADWRVYFSPHSYFAWLKRESETMPGQVIGPPLVKEFPASPPIGIAGGVRDGELWIDAIVPNATIQAASAHLKK